MSGNRTPKKLLLTFAHADPSQVPGTRQRNLCDCALLFLAESHLHWLGDSILRHHISLHGRALAMLHVLYRLDSVASHISARYHPCI